MHAVSIRYPRAPGESFDFRHWAEVHMPMGLATLEKIAGVSPVRVMVQHETAGLDGDPDSADSYITVWLLFADRSGLDGFLKVHRDARNEADLRDDIPKYAPRPPSITLGQLTVFDDIDAVLKQGRPLL